jgi:hypothetical protein
MHPSDIDLKELERITLQLLPLGIATPDIRRTQDAMALQTAVNG